MKKIRTKLILAFIIFSTISAFTLEYLIRNVIPEYGVKYYSLIPILFFVLGIPFILILTRKQEKVDDKRVANEYLMIKVVKVLLSLFLLAVYWINNGAEVKTFGVIYILFYLLFLFFETFVYFQVEKELKRKRENKTSLEV